MSIQQRNALTFSSHDYLLNDSGPVMTNCSSVRNCSVAIFFEALEQCSYKIVKLKSAFFRLFNYTFSSILYFDSFCSHGRTANLNRIVTVKLSTLNGEHIVVLRVVNIQSVTLFFITRISGGVCREGADRR